MTPSLLHTCFRIAPTARIARSVSRLEGKEHSTGVANLRSVLRPKDSDSRSPVTLIDRHAPAPDDPYFPNSTNAFVMYDRATDWTECYPQMTLSYENAIAAMKQFEGSHGRRVRSFYADNFPSITKAARAMRWVNSHSTAGVPLSLIHI